MKGLSLLKMVISKFEPGALQGALLGQGKLFVQFFEGLISLMAQSPDAVQRDSAFRSLVMAMGIFDELGRFTLLRDLSARCPFPAAKSVLVGCIKDSVDRSWGNDAATSLFAGPPVLTLVTPLLRLGSESMSAVQLMEGFDIFASSANLYLFFLLRDSLEKNQVRSIWD